MPEQRRVRRVAMLGLTFIPEFVRIKNELRVLCIQMHTDYPRKLTWNQFKFSRELAREAMGPPTKSV